MRFFSRIALLMLVPIALHAQVSIVSKRNFDFVRGVYKVQSEDSARLASWQKTIAPQVSLQSINQSFAFLFPPAQGILLFKTKDLLNAPIAGKLLQASMIRIDTIYYNQAYRSGGDPDYTFDICYALQINRQKYYTDFRPHQFVPFKAALPAFRQTLMLVGQSTGYAMYADVGYPNHFHIVVFDEKNGTLQMRFDSGRLPFNYVSEYWKNEELLKAGFDEPNKVFVMEINAQPAVRAIWDGNALSVE